MNLLGGGVREYRLLIVEGDRHSFDELRGGLAELGYECEVALDIQTARSILTERRMDVAIVNARFGETDDEELIAEMKAQDPSMRLVLYNGTAKGARRRRLRRMGADSYLSPSSDLPAVVRAARRVIEERL